MARQPLRSLLLAPLGALVPALLFAQGGGGFQAPPKNLQVLPKDLTRNEVTARMRQIALGLGVRCEYCHVQSVGPDGREQTDHASDDKETKKIAREMMKMVNDINDKYLIAGMGKMLSERDRVTCETCHHGLAKPRTLQAALAEAVEDYGADSAVALYRDLRGRYYGRAAYDFGELSLTEAARIPNQRAANIALLRLNLEFYPQSAPTLGALGQQLAQSGDTAGAVDALTKAIALDSTNRQLRNLLTRLKGGRP